MGMNTFPFFRNLCLGLSSFVLANSAFAARDLTVEIDHVMLVVFENTDFASAQRLPFFNLLAIQGVNFVNYSGVAHPSQPNYFSFTAGSTLDVVNDYTVTKDVRHLGDLLEEKGKTWKVYVQGWPGNCYLGTRSGNYVRKHNPFISFKNIQDSPARCNRIVDASNLQTDIENGDLADFSLYIPDLKNDGHDTGGAYADHWYQTTFAPLLVNTKFTKALLLMTTFDESETQSSNHIYTSFWGDSVQHGRSITTPYNHFNLIRTLEYIFDLGNLNENDESAATMERWRR